jgi:hypothetical protein
MEPGRALAGQPSTSPERKPRPATVGTKDNVASVAWALWSAIHDFATLTRVSIGSTSRLQKTLLTTMAASKFRVAETQCRAVAMLPRGLSVTSVARSVLATATAIDTRDGVPDLGTLGWDHRHAMLRGYGWPAGAMQPHGESLRRVPTRRDGRWLRPAFRCRPDRK